MEKPKKRPRKKRKTKAYTSGQMNKLIDDVCHPLFNENAGFILVDGLLHGIVEQDPPTTVRKFMRYSLPKILKELTRKQKNAQS